MCAHVIECEVQLSQAAEPEISYLRQLRFHPELII